MTDTDRLTERFLEALDNGDLQTLQYLWQQGCEQPELGRLLAEMIEEAARELEPPGGWQFDVAKVQTLLRQHLPSGFPPEGELPALAASDVAAKLQSDGFVKNLSDEDQLANKRLRDDATLIPEDLGAPQLQAWVAKLGISASERYWKQFRKTAVLMSLGRSQQGAKLLAARKQQSK
jgi:hypothetical protein